MFFEMLLQFHQFNCVAGVLIGLLAGEAWAFADMHGSLVHVFKGEGENVLEDLIAISASEPSLFAEFAGAPSAFPAGYQRCGCNFLVRVVYRGLYRSGYVCRNVVEDVRKIKSVKKAAGAVFLRGAVLADVKGFLLRVDNLLNMDGGFILIAYFANHVRSNLLRIGGFGDDPVPHVDDAVCHSRNVRIMSYHNYCFT